MRAGRAGAAAVVLAALATLGAACEERICRGGEHPVRSIEAPDTGRTCVRDGEPPPAGYEEYPPGRHPGHQETAELVGVLGQFAAGVLDADPRRAGW